MIRDSEIVLKAENERRKAELGKREAEQKAEEDKPARMPMRNG
jgi:hypothetical protein